MLDSGAWSFSHSHVSTLTLSDSHISALTQLLVFRRDSFCRKSVCVLSILKSRIGDRGHLGITRPDILNSTFFLHRFVYAYFSTLVPIKPTSAT